MLQHVERAEKTAMEKKIIEQEGIIAYQKRELTELAGIRADYERMKQALENAQNELVSSPILGDQRSPGRFKKESALKEIIPGGIEGRNRCPKAPAQCEDRTTDAPPASDMR